MITRNQRRQLDKDNLRQSTVLTEVPKDKWPIDGVRNRVKVFRSKSFLVQEYIEGFTVRISVNRCLVDENGDWAENISWEDLQRIKREIGYGDNLAVEIYPKDKDVVNVASMRHLWFPERPLDFGWKSNV